MTFSNISGWLFTLRHLTSPVSGPKSCSWTECKDYSQRSSSTYVLWYSVAYFLTWTLHWPIINKMFTNIKFLRLRGIIQNLYNICFIVFVVLLIRVISLTGPSPTRGNGAGLTSKTRYLPTARNFWCVTGLKDMNHHVLSTISTWFCPFDRYYGKTYMFIAMGYTWEILSGLTHEAFW